MCGQHHEIDRFVVDNPQQLIAWIALATQVDTGAVGRILNVGPYPSEISTRDLLITLNEGLLEF